MMEKLKNPLSPFLFKKYKNNNIPISLVCYRFVFFLYIVQEHRNVIWLRESKTAMKWGMTEGNTGVAKSMNVVNTGECNE